MTTPRLDNQRFYLARLAAAALIGRDDQVLAVSDAYTALQKLERSFAQDEYFGVSQLVVERTLETRANIVRRPRQSTPKRIL